MMKRSLLTGFFPWLLKLHKKIVKRIHSVPSLQNVFIIDNLREALIRYVVLLSLTVINSLNF